jgi:hypothetical protein
VSSSSEYLVDAGLLGTGFPQPARLGLFRGWSRGTWTVTHQTQSRRIQVPTRVQSLPTITMPRKLNERSPTLDVAISTTSQKEDAYQYRTLRQESPTTPHLGDLHDSNRGRIRKLDSQAQHEAPTSTNSIRTEAQNGPRKKSLKHDDMAFFLNATGTEFRYSSITRLLSSLPYSIH